MAQKVREFDWEASPLGPVEDWSTELKTAVNFVLENHFPSALVWGPALVTIYNDAFLPILGNKPEALGRSFELIWSEAWRDIGPIAQLALAGQSTYIEDFPVEIDRTGKSEQAFFTFSYSPVRSTNGAVLGMIDTVIDTTGAVRARQAIRESQERLNRVLETEAVGVIFFNHQGVVVDANDAFLKMTGYAREQIARRELHWSRMIPPEWVAASEEQMGKLEASGRIGPYEMTCILADGSRRWMHFAGRDLGDGTIAQYCIDIDEQKQSEEALSESERHAQFLLAELQHRVRNTLAIVRSIARRTAECTVSATDMLAHFQGRLDAFSRVQAALTRSANAKIDLASLIQDELVAHAASEGKQVRIEGPKVTLEPNEAERLGLAIHELTTNAVKHGALINGDGRVEIGWKRQSNGCGTELVLSWNESGIELDQREIKREGFGMELLRRSLPYDLEGQTKVEFEPTGLRFELRMPLPASAAA